MEYIVTSDPGDISEPIEVDAVKSFMGYPLSETSQDETILKMITAAREWIEQRTALSLVSKKYKAYFDQEDADDGWFELPVSPVDLNEDITVTMNGTATTYQRRGLKIIRIYPDSVISTIAVGGSSIPSYLEVEFTAGGTNNQANQALTELASFMFNNREGGSTVSIFRLPYDLRSRINAMSVNV